MSLSTHDFVDTGVTSTRWQKAKTRTLEIAHEVRDRLRALLGGVCQKCSSTDELQFHHPHGRTWEPRKKNLRHRMRLYERDYEAGQLGLLCKTCNGTDGYARLKFYAEVKNRQTVLTTTPDENE